MTARMIDPSARIEAGLAHGGEDRIAVRQHPRIVDEQRAGKNDRRPAHIDAILSGQKDEATPQHPEQRRDGVERDILTGLCG